MANYTTSKIVLPNGDECTLKDSKAREDLASLTPANLGAKPTQTAVTDPTASGTAIAFIDSISQNAQGVISPTKKTVQSASQSTAGLMSAADKVKLDGIVTAPLASATYTEVIATANSNNGAGFFCLKVRPEAWDDIWHVRVRVTATVPSNVNYQTVTESDIWGSANTYLAYSNKNTIKSTSYRPIYYVSLFRMSQTGYNNACGHWIGFNLYSATNPTDTGLKRTVKFELLEYDHCEAELSNSLITPNNIPDRAVHTGWYTSTNTSFDNFDASSNGLRFTGDQNTTTISNLCLGNELYTAKNAIYRYQLLFTVSGNTLTPLNTANNVTAATKTLLTDEAFDPTGRMFYYNSTTVRAQNVTWGASTDLAYKFSTVDLRYTFNITDDGSRTVGLPIYIKVTPQGDGLCKLASADPLTQALPSSEDGYLYITLGRVYDWYRITLWPDKPVYCYMGGALVRYTGSKEQLDFLVCSTARLEAVEARTGASAAIYGKGANGQALMSNGNNVYWGTPSGAVTGVKGNAESTYRTGNVNLTPANIGAVDKTGDTMTGNLTVEKAGDVRVIVKSTDTAAKAYLQSSSSGNHGIASSGYFNGSDFVTADKWMIYRNSTGRIIFNDTVGIDHGGTNATTPAQARTNLEITPANIGAAVAQVFKGNIDDLMTSGIYYLNGATGTGGTQSDNKLWGMLIVSATSNGSRTIQLHIDIWSDVAEFRRYDGTWHGWKHFTLS